MLSVRRRSLAPHTCDNVRRLAHVGDHSRPKLSKHLFRSSLAVATSASTREIRTASAWRRRYVRPSLATHRDSTVQRHPAPMQRLVAGPCKHKRRARPSIAVLCWVMAARCTGGPRRRTSTCTGAVSSRSLHRLASQAAGPRGLTQQRRSGGGLLRLCIGAAGASVRVVTRCSVQNCRR